MAQTPVPKLAHCDSCGADGTIVEMKICCKVRVWEMMGPAFELKYCPDKIPPAKRVERWS